MSLNFAAICPHPPIIIPGVGKKKDMQKCRKTITAMNRLSQYFKKKNIDTVIIITPHGKIKKNTFTVPSPEKKVCDLGNASFNLNNDIKIRQKISLLKNTETIKTKEFDHGSCVPLYYLKKNIDSFDIVSITYSMESRKKHYHFGKRLFKIIKESNKRIALIASGDLSHRLNSLTMSECDEGGKQFDEKIVQLIKSKKIKEIINMEAKLVNRARECGYKSILILLGALSEINYKVNLLSYEAPFGVGYGVFNFKLEK